MATTPRCKFPYPDEFSNPWYDIFKSFVEAVDFTLYATREDRNIVVFGGGTVSWDAGSSTLAWTSSIYFLASVTGYRWVLAAGSVTLADGQLAYFTAPRAPQNQQTVTLTVGTTTPSEPNGDAQILFAVRSGSTVHFRDGFVLGDGAGQAVFDQTSGDANSGGVLFAFTADSNYTLTPAQYAKNWLEFTTGSWTAGHSIILPLPASKAVGYYKTVFNNTAYTMTVSAGSGTTRNLTSGQCFRLWVDNLGVRFASTNITP